jgi:chromate transporter
MIDPFTYFLIALKAAFLSSGGLANIPSLHQDLFARQWVSDRQFAGAISIGQLAPGPTGLWVIALGYLTAGLGGAALMLIAIVIPPLLVIPLSVLHRRTSHRAIVRGFSRGLSIAAASTVPAVVIFRILSTYGYTPLSVALVILSFVVLAVRRVSPILVLAVGAAIGAAFFRP